MRPLNLWARLEKLEDDPIFVKQKPDTWSRIYDALRAIELVTAGPTQRGYPGRSKRQIEKLVRDRFGTKREFIQKHAGGNHNG